MKAFPKNEDELVKMAEKLGVSFDSSTTDTGLDRSIIQNRILTVLNERRQSSLWLIALISSIASVLSAIAACYLAVRH